MKKYRSYTISALVFYLLLMCSVIIGYAACECTISLSVSNININVEADAGEIDLSGSASASINKSNCDDHKNSTVTPTYSFTIVSQSGGTGAVSGNKLNVIDIENKYTATVKVTASFNGKSTYKNITVTATRLKGTPSIIFVGYNGQTHQAELRVIPNGNKTAEIYLRNADGEDEFVQNVTFQRQFFKYKEQTIYITLNDVTDPNPVKNFSVSRKILSGQKYVTVSWEDNDADQLHGIIAKSGIKESNLTNINVKTSTYETIVSYAEYGPYKDMANTLVNKTSSNSIDIRLDQLYWDTKLEFISYDMNNNMSSSIICGSDIINKGIYTTKVIDDNESNCNKCGITEGDIVPIPVKENDIHDTYWNTPLLSEAAIIEPIFGAAKIKDISSFTAADDVQGITGLVLEYSSSLLEKDEPLEVKIRYTYEKVREDIPAATGICTVKVYPMNSPPVAVDDDLDITSTWGISFESGKTFDIPVELMLLNDTDRETPTNKLVVSEVTTTYLGDVRLITANGNTFVRVTTSASTYGVFKFQYKILDEFNVESISWGTVSIEVTKETELPLAKDSSENMQLSQSGEEIIVKNISLNVENKGNVGYSIADFENTTIPSIRVNGSSDISKYKISLSKGRIQSVNNKEIPYIRMTIQPGSALKAGDKITFDYGISYDNHRSYATITINALSGDDPDDREGYLYVHRRPLAIFTPIVDINKETKVIRSCTIGYSQEGSFDLDHQYMHSTDVKSISAGGRRPDYSWMGIRAWEWGIRTIDSEWTTRVFDAEGKSGSDGPGGNTPYNGSAEKARKAGIDWIQSQLNTLITSLNSTGRHKTVMVSLRVRDIDSSNTVGVWSDSRIIVLTSEPLPPIANFRTDKSSYVVPLNPSEDFKMQLTDLSFDPNGDPIKTWQWEIKDGYGKVTAITKTDRNPDLENVQEIMSNLIAEKLRSKDYNPDTPDWTISLKVIEDTEDKLESDIYSYTFPVFIENQTPKIEDDNTSMTILGSTVYEEDLGLDGFKGDDWGTTTTGAHSGKPDFNKMFNITDDQVDSLGNPNTLSINWLFEGESVTARKYWNEDNWIMTQKSISGLKYKQEPFLNTVTQQGFEPGAYKISITATDNPPSGGKYQDNASKTAYWNTYGEPPEAPPYHLYVVPSLTLKFSIEVNGWRLQVADGKEITSPGSVISGSKPEDFGYTWIRVSDGKDYKDAGVALEDIVPTIGDLINIKVITNKHVTGLYFYNDTNKSGKFDNTDDKVVMQQTKINANETIEWSGTYTLDEVEDPDIDPSTGEYYDLTVLQFGLFGETYWGSEDDKTITRTKEIPIPMSILPIKLYDFRVTEITDPNIATSFRNYVDRLKIYGDTLENGNITNGALVGRLAVESKDYEGEDIDIAKGYSFYFEVCSKGLKKDGDQIRITPKFFGIDTNGNIACELTGYVPGQDGKYKPYTIQSGYDDNYINSTYRLYYEGEKIHSLNNHGYIIIGTDLRKENGPTEQIWYGRYGIPGDAKFFKKDESNLNLTSEWKGKILIAFEIEAYKDGRSRYDYVGKKQWLKEREEIEDDGKTNWINIENSWFNNKSYFGTVILYDGARSIHDDYTSNPIWRE